MGTTCEVAADVDATAIEAAFDEIIRVDSLLSTWRDNSELALVNRNASESGVEVSGELFAILELANDWARRTDGAFNPLVAPLVHSWNLRGEGAQPDEDQLADAIVRSRPENLTLDVSNRVVRLEPGAAIEEGAFGKGYAIDLAMKTLVNDVCSECFIDFGGQIAVRSGTPRTVFIANPELRREPALSIVVTQASVATTSGSEKWFDAPSGRLSHVIDPRTGRALPPRGSATVVHEIALVADILSTALYVMGPDAGIRWADANEIAAVFITPHAHGWSVESSIAANNPALGLATVSGDFQLKGQPQNASQTRSHAHPSPRGVGRMGRKPFH